MEPNHKEGRYDFADKSMYILFLTTQVQLKNKDIKKVRVFTEYIGDWQQQFTMYIPTDYSPLLYFLAKKTCKKNVYSSSIIISTESIYAELSTFFKAKQTCNASGIPLHSNLDIANQRTKPSSHFEDLLSILLLIQ